ncbi:MAG: NusG domain II-containing protein [Clostridium sulfidigenes]|uniref:NusG domain II-containing protein n=2 Tax=Clostridiaceae TaxID=31979 RepID=A0A927W409_9CLOT|nr:NusG domain II-containing protein [Clostridium sulfidigenes]
MNMKLMKRMDIVIIVVLLIVSFIPYIMLKNYQSNYKGINYAVISIDGKETKRVELTTGLDEEFTIKSSYGFNRVVIHDMKIGIVDADCKDEICVNEGFIGAVGERIVCLPNRLIIEIVGEQKSSEGEDVISR